MYGLTENRKAEIDQELVMGYNFDSILIKEGKLTYTISLIEIATGMNGESIYALIYNPNGNGIDQIAPPLYQGKIFRMEGFETIRDVSVAPKWNTIGYAMTDDTTSEELERLFKWHAEGGTVMRIVLDEEYLDTEATRAVQKHSLWPKIEQYLYQI